MGVYRRLVKSIEHNDFNRVREWEGGGELGECIKKGGKVGRKYRKKGINGGLEKDKYKWVLVWKNFHYLKG